MLNYNRIQKTRLYFLALLQQEGQTLVGEGCPLPVSDNAKYKL